MTEILEHIDELIIDCLINAESFGLCHLVEDTAGTYPTGYTSESRKVAPTSKTSISFYHRLLNGSIGVNEDLSFGRYKARQNAQRVRTVVFIPIDNSKSDIDDFINAIPDSIVLDNYKKISLSETVDLIRDSAAVWSQEFPEAFKAKWQKVFQLYAVEYSIEYIKCKVCVGLRSDSGTVLLTDDGDMLVPDRNELLVTDDGDLLQTDSQ